MALVKEAFMVEEYVCVIRIILIMVYLGVWTDWLDCSVHFENTTCSTFCIPQNGYCDNSMNDSCRCYWGSERDMCLLQRILWQILRIQSWIFFIDKYRYYFLFIAIDIFTYAIIFAILVFIFVIMYVLMDGNWNV